MELGHRRPVRIGRFPFGFVHYPEHASEEERRIDVDLIASTGANVVRMAEFAWDRMEPEPGRFDFSLFDEQVAAFEARGIDTILGTPTAIAPPWMTVLHPDHVRVDHAGVRQQHGSRQHASLAHPGFRERCRIVVDAMVTHFREVPGVIGWQVDNELNTHFADDHNQAALLAFRRWLEQRYGNVDALNGAWGNCFWSQTVRSFDEVLIPIDMRPAAVNTSAMLDYKRFLQWLSADFLREQIEVVRAANPEWFVFHNVGIPNGANYRGDLGRNLDVLAFDVYPMLFDFDPTTRSRTHRRTIDAMRAWTGNMLCPEHQVGTSSWRFVESDRPEPGELRRMVWLSIASGMDGMVFYRWRTARFGPEMYWEGVVDHAGRTDHRLAELTDVKRELDVVAEYLVDTWVHVDAAVAGADQCNLDAHQTLHLGLPAPDAVGSGVHDALVERGWQAGFVHPSDDLSDVRLYVFPHWVIVEPAWIERLAAWVEAGGTLVVGARTGTRDANNHVLRVPPPGPLADLAGVRVDEYGRQNGRARLHRFSFAGSEIDSAHWYERLTPAPRTETIGRWTTRHLAGTSAVTRRRQGAGSVVYVGTYLERAVIDAVLDVLGTDVMAPLGPVPDGVLRIIRRNERRRLTFLVNGSDETRSVVAPKGARPLLKSETILPPNDVRVYAESQR